MLHSLVLPLLPLGRPTGRGSLYGHASSCRKVSVFAIPSALAGRRVLIVEDEFAVALMIEDFLLECGCIVMGPYDAVTKTLEAVRNETFDFAILDVKLDGETVYSVANALDTQRIPFIFLSGYGPDAIPPGHPDWKVCSKPFRGAELASMLSALIS